MTNILIVDDHRMFSDGLSSILTKHHQYTVSCAVNASQALDFLYEKHFDIVLMDVQMPGSKMNGIELTDRIRIEFPDVRVLIVSMNKSAHTVDELVKVGAKGYIIKDSGYETLLLAIKAMEAGKDFWDPKILQLLIEQKREGLITEKPKEQRLTIELTAREKDVLKCLAEGLSSKQIGVRLFIGASTVDTHRKNMISKFGAKNTTEVVMKAKEFGLL